MEEEEARMKAEVQLQDAGNIPAQEGDIEQGNSNNTSSRRQSLPGAYAEAPTGSGEEGAEGEGGTSNHNVSGDGVDGEDVMAVAMAVAGGEGGNLQQAQRVHESPRRPSDAADAVTRALDELLPDLKAR